jgi:serine phosphatase RsbU (regulator of sigma subunit)
MVLDQGRAQQERTRGTRAALTGALEELAGAARTVAAGDVAEGLEAVARATARALGADLVVVRVAQPDGRGLVAGAVASASPAVAAELEGSSLRLDSLLAGEAGTADRVPGPVRATAAAAGFDAVLFVPVQARGRLVCSIEVGRSGEPFDEVEHLVARLAAEQVAAAVRSPERLDGAIGFRLELAADALGATLDGTRTPAEIARLAARAGGAREACVWRVRGSDPGSLEPLAISPGNDEDRRFARLRSSAVRALGLARPLVVDDAGGGSDDPAAVVTLELGRPSAFLLQLVFSADELPDEEGLARLATFAARAAQALDAGQRAVVLTSELERARTLLAAVGQASAELSLDRTVRTVAEHVAELLGVERVGVYFREDGVLVEAAAKSLSGPHVEIAERLLELALRRRRRNVLAVADAARDRRLAGLEDEVAQTGIESAFAVPLLVPDDVVGLVAVYPPRGRVLGESESALFASLAAQLAVTLQNARLHDRATELGTELESSLQSERKSARQLGSLYEISRSFTQSLSLELTLDAVVRTVVELLEIDAAVIRMPDPRGERLIPHALHVADVHLAESLRTILARPQPVEELADRSLLRAGRPIALDAESAARLGDVHRLLQPFLVKGATAVVLPIATPTELIGTLTLLSLDPERPITPESTQLGLTVAQQAALALENARLYHHQKEFADTMQQSLLPRSHPELEGLDVGDLYASSARLDVGGDLYDFLALEDGRLAVILGDVCGKGIAAAADMAMAKFVFRTLARDHPDPGDFLALANDVVCDEIATGKFVTMLYLTIDSTGQLACASAGHPQPRLVLPDGEVRGLDVRGVALGIEHGQRYEVVRETLVPGAGVVLYTDGAIEARRGTELYGHERLDATLVRWRGLSAQVIAQSVLADCRAFTGGDLLDDCALVVIKRTGGA